MIMPATSTVYIEEAHGPDGITYRIPGPYAYTKTKAEAVKMATEIHKCDESEIEIRPEGPG